MLWGAEGPPRVWPAARFSEDDAVFVCDMSVLAYIYTCLKSFPSTRMHIYVLGENFAEASLHHFHEEALNILETKHHSKRVCC